MRIIIQYIAAAGWVITFSSTIILVWLFPLSFAWFWFFIASIFFLFGYYAISSGDEDDECEEPIEQKEKEEPYIVELETKCKNCGAPMDDDTCDYCGCKSAIYKVIR